MALTLWGRGYDDLRLRQMAAQLKEALDRSARHLGGHAHWRPSAPGLRDARSARARRARPRSAHDSTVRSRPWTSASPRAASSRANQSTRLEAGSWPSSVGALRNLVVGAAGGAPIRLSDVASVADDGGEPADYVAYHPNARESYPAVTVSIAKRKGTNAITLTQQVQRKVDALARLPPAERSAGHGHAQLRRDGRAEVERAALAHAARDSLGVGAHLARARAARVGCRAHRDSRHARAHAASSSISTATR